MNKINLIRLSKNKEGELFKKEINGSLILTYNLDLVFYENWVLRKFRELGSVNNLVLADLLQLRITENVQHEYLRYDSSSYISEGVALGNLFHPKIIYLTSDDEDRLFIGSGNLTIGGYSNNVELYSQFSSNNPGEKEIFIDFYGYIDSLLDRSKISSFFKKRTERLLVKKADILVEAGENKGRFKFLHNLDIPIIKQIENETKEIQHVYAISPFFDSDLSAVKYIKDNICKDISIFFQEDYTNIKTDNISDEFKFYKFPNNSSSEGNLHAKLLIFETNNNLSILMGSPNLTKAALLSNAKDGNVETAILFKNLNINLLDYYLPRTKDKIEPENVLPINIPMQGSKENLLIKSANLNNQGVLEINLWKHAETKPIIEVFLSNVKVDAGNVTFNETSNRIELKGIYESDNVLKVYVIINDLKSNVVIVVNQQKSLTSLLKGETKVLNELKNVLKVDSFERLLFARSFDPLVDIQKQESIEYLKLHKTEINDEKTEVELDIEKSVSDFYISVKELGDNDTFQVKDSPSYLLDLLKIFKHQQIFIKSKEINKPSETDTSKSSNTENKESDLSRFRKILIHNFENNISYLSSQYQKSKKEGLNEKEAFSYVRNTSNTLPLFDLLLSGLEMEVSAQDTVLILLSRVEIREYLYWILKIIYVFWSSVLLHNNNFKKVLGRKYLINFYILCVMNLLLIEECINKDVSHINIQLNKQLYTYMFSSISILLCRVNNKFDFSNDELLKSGDELSNKFTNHIIKKLSLTEDFLSRNQRFIESVNKLYTIDQEVTVSKSLSNSLNRMSEYSILEAINSTVKK